MDSKCWRRSPKTDTLRTIRQPCNSRRLVLTLERATDKVRAISSAAIGRGDRNRRAWTWATVRLMPQRVPISPQWRMNFWAAGESDFDSSVISVCTEITVFRAICQDFCCGTGRYFRTSNLQVSHAARNLQAFVE